MPRLSGKQALVTGGARGIGAAIATAFVREGADTLIIDIDRAGGERHAAAIGATFHSMDVTDEAAWEALLTIRPRIDIHVNNAGITGFEDGAAAHDPENASLSEWRRVHAINLDGTFLGCRYAIRAMRAAGGAGSIINLSSRSGMVGVPGAAAYASSKAAIRNHSKSVALYCAAQGLSIRCNSLHPGAILTPMWEALIGDAPGREERMAALVADTPLHRFGKAEEVAAVAVMLASDEATYVTGAEIAIDGGLTAGMAASPGE